jgi:hypothetical protein
MSKPETTILPMSRTEKIGTATLILGDCLFSSESPLSPVARAYGTTRISEDQPSPGD